MNCLQELRAHFSAFALVSVSQTRSALRLSIFKMRNSVFVDSTFIAGPHFVLAKIENVINSNLESCGPLRSDFSILNQHVE